MLHLRKGKSSKNFENDFFRKMSQELSQIFEKKNWDGILIGMPQCIRRDDLQIDCLLVTNDQLIIIDYKNYSGELHLPSEDNFKDGTWKINGEVAVRGGSFSNPFKQLSKQRFKLIDQLKYQLEDFDKTSISTIVCFHNKIEVNGDIPNKYKLYFSISDSSNYINKVVDIVDIVSNKKRNYLIDENRNIFIDKVFASEEYNSDEHDKVKEDIKWGGKTSTHHDVVEQVKDFLSSSNRVLTLTGNTRSGKTALIPEVREIAFKEKYGYIPVFLYSNRYINKMAGIHPNIEEVNSLFSSIYDFNQVELDENYCETYPLKVNTETDLDINELYIFDDSHLISNSRYETESLKFGSGYLLNDVLSYLELEKYPNRKILFIGDRNKISYGSHKEYALNSSYLQGLLERKQINSHVIDIQLPDSEEDSKIVEVCNTISSCIKKSHFNDLMIDSGDEVTIIESNKDKINMGYEAYKFPYQTKFLAYSKKQASNINMWIKKNISQNGSELNTNDFIIFENKIIAFENMIEYKKNASNNQSNNNRNLLNNKVIQGGSFGTIIHIDSLKVINKIVSVNQEDVILRFLTCQIKLQDGSVINTLVLKNYLQAGKGELSKNERIAYRIILNNYEKEAFDKNPFEKSQEFKDMMKDKNEVVELEREGKTVYRNAKDKRQLTAYEKTYQKRILTLLNEPTSEYFQVLNAARINYAWAMTVNKAMAYSYDTIILNTKQTENRPQSNKGYFRWLYTGISGANHNVKLTNWTPLSSFLTTEFRKTGTNIPNNLNVIHKCTDELASVTEQLRVFLNNRLKNSALIESMTSNPYLETVTVQIENRKLELLFYYNKKGEVKAPTLKKGDKKDLEFVNSLLEFNEETIPDSLMAIINTINRAIEKADIKLLFLKNYNWSFIIKFMQQYEQVSVQIVYNNNYNISQFNYIEGSELFYDNIVSLIRNYYSLVEEV